ncbi:hypothetical protein QC764_500770 [Podospora pseudoanserina]|uniref:protein-ribulosamine 3-kinase n=1 Tax=Podospora pseudoanserina TaxID=2609844 RepID=A0ABR0I4W4_9PEZI|nr:hypothetical protein QC764_500770 [Podospora pseudoanserina]
MSRGPYSEEEAKLKEDFVPKVLPRYLRPLESGGRSIDPALCHTDLWPGNVKYRLDNEPPLVFDVNALWAHSELELGLFRNPRYLLDRVNAEEKERKVAQDGKKSFEVKIESVTDDLKVLAT